MASTSVSKKSGLDFGYISGAEWLVIIGAFLGTYVFMFYQTTIQVLGAFFGMDSFEVGIGFALFTVAFATAAFVMHKFKPAQLRNAEMLSLVLLGVTMPLYLFVKGMAEAYILMTIDGLLVGLIIDSFMTMAGMASLDQSKRQIEQAAFAFWTSLASIVAAFTTGLLLKLGIAELFAISAVMALIAVAFVAGLRGKHSLKYVPEPREKGEKVKISSLFKNRQFDWAFVSALGYTIPFFMLMSFGVRYGHVIGFSAETVFYLFAVMFTINVVTRLYLRMKSPIVNKYPYMVAALVFATLAAFVLYGSFYVGALFYLAFVLIAIPYGIVWTLGLQIANTSFKANEIPTSTSFFSSGMMIMSAVMPVIGIMSSDRSIGFGKTFLTFAIVTFVFLLIEVFLRPTKAKANATGSNPSSIASPVPAESFEKK
ncbi:MAG: MFS transporter [Thermoplasmata archaeon]